MTRRSSTSKELDTGSFCAAKLFCVEAEHLTAKRGHPSLRGLRLTAPSRQRDKPTLGEADGVRHLTRTPDYQLPFHPMPATRGAKKVQLAPLERVPLRPDVVARSS